MSWLRRFASIAVLTLLWLTPHGWAQRVPVAPPDIPAAGEHPQGQAPDWVPGPLPNPEAAQQKKRFEDIQRDAARLLALATELKQYVDKSGENVLSLEVVRKAEEMEKLARQVKNNMRGQ
jgi:hypothetical protein